LLKAAVEINTPYLFVRFAAGLLLDKQIYIKLIKLLKKGGEIK